jgi:exodeoxyribonuclease VII large subunit
MLERDLFTSTEETSPRPLSVSELTSQVKSLLEEGFEACWVMGEISQYTHHNSGHRYFTLKDADSQLSAVMFKWQSRGLSFEPESGMQVLVYGSISVYERSGRYQFYAARMQPAGVGELALAFEQLKSRLAAEGMFDEERKRPLPSFPRSIGVVTSPTGAAIRDIVQVLSRRAPGIQIVLSPARVQGDGAAAEIVRGIENLNRHGVDILIVGRGGGSPEDLWPFNEEVVARAIYTSEKPVISAVGHEIDYSISDYVADYRAPTPSAAAEIVVQEHGALQNRVVELNQRLKTSIDGRLDHLAAALRHLDPRRVLMRARDRLQQNSQYLDERRKDLATAFDWYARKRSEEFHNTAVRLDDLSPLKGLARGFSLCENEHDGRLVQRADELELGARVKLRFHSGSATCTVEEIQDE